MGVTPTQRLAGIAGVLAATALLLPATGTAQTKPRPAAPAKVAPAAECRAQVAVLEHNAGKLAVRVRTNCPVSREQLKAALLEVKPSAFADGARPVELRVDLGRIAEHPWLSSAFARAALASKEWDKSQGKPRQRNINQFAGALLRISGTLDGLAPGWAVQGVATEKVLVQSARAMPELGLAPGDKALVPYDAQLWVQYALAPAGAPQAGEAGTVIPPARLDE